MPIDLGRTFGASGRHASALDPRRASADGPKAVLLFAATGHPTLALKPKIIIAIKSDPSKVLVKFVDRFLNEKRAKAVSSATTAPVIQSFRGELGASLR
jgi:hypothetical protein